MRDTSTPRRSPSVVGQSGFTIIEIVVTMIVLGIFLGGFLQTFILIENQRANVARQAKASDIAYSYLRQHNTRPNDPDTSLPSNTPLQCRLSGGSTNRILVNNQDISIQFGSNARLTITASSPTNTCSGVHFPSGTIKIEAAVMYGTNQEVRHASFVSQ